MWTTRAQTTGGHGSPVPSRLQREADTESVILKAAQ